MIGRIVFFFFVIAATASTSSAVVVSAAASLKEPLSEIAKTFEAEAAERVEFEFAASGQIAARILQGARVDVFISAADKQIADLEKTGMTASPRDIVARNRLVLIAPAGSSFPTRWEDLADPRVRKIAIGAPATVPAGEYALQVLQAMKLNDRVADRLVHGANVRQVLDYVVRGEVDAGVVYVSDAQSAGGSVRTVQLAAEDLHDPIRYTAVIVKGSTKPELAAKFIEELRSERGQAVFRGFGFGERIAGQPEVSTQNSQSIWSAMMLSLRVALLATVLTAFIAIPLAYMLARWRFFGRTALDAILMVPLILPPTVVGYFILLALGSRSALGSWLQSHGIGLVFTLPGAVVAAAIVALPMLYLPASAAFASVDREMEDTARLFGANVLQVFWHVSLPLARRGIANGLLLAFARALGEFGATVMVFGSGPRQTLPISIYNDYLAGNFSHAAPAVAALTAISLAVIALYNRWGLVRRGD